MDSDEELVVPDTVTTDENSDNCFDNCFDNCSDEKPSVSTPSEVRFRHTRCGTIEFPERDEYFCIVEFTIEQCNKDGPPGISVFQSEGPPGISEFLSEGQPDLVFDVVQRKSGWFYIDIDSTRLIGPYEQNDETQEITFTFFDVYESTQIKNIDDDPSCLITQEEIPVWMIHQLLKKTVVSDL